MSVKLFKVESLTTTNKFYIVRLIDGKYFCNCPHFLVREKRIKTCKHIDKIKQQHG